MSLMLAAPFIHPWIAAGAPALAAIPIVIHLLNRRRFRQMDWAAMDFLLAASRRTARRVRIEQILLLATRVLIVLLAALAVARPFLPASPLSEAGLARTHRLILLDTSGSMRAVGRSGQTGFERARALAQRLLDSFPRGDIVSLVLLAGPATALIEQGSVDRSAVASVLSSVEVSQSNTDIAGGLQLARSILGASDAAPGNRVVYLISDNAATGWGPTGTSSSPAARLAGEIAREARLIVLHCGLIEAENSAVTSLQPVANLIRPDWPARWKAEVANFGRYRQMQAALEVVHAGRVVRTEPLEPLPAGGRVYVPFQLHIAEPGQCAVEVRLRQTKPDLLDLDDHRWYVADVRPQLPVLLVDGKPGPTRFTGETGYLSAAMAPKRRTTERTWVVPKSVTDMELGAEALEEYRLIVLCNVRRLDPAMWRKLLDYAAAGGAVWFFLGDQVGAEQYNQYGFADGKGVLPARLSAPVGQDGSQEKFFRLEAGQPPHPAVAELAAHAASGLFLSRVFRYWQAVPNDGPSQADVILRYDNGDPALLGRRIGQGYALISTTTANMAWTNLPAKGDFVSLVMEMVTRLVPSQSASRNVAVGEPLRLPVSAAQSSLPIRLVKPDGASINVALRRDGDRFWTDFTGTEQSGLYQFRIGEERRPAAVNVDESESNLRSLSGDELAALLQCEFEYVEEGDNPAAAWFDAPHRELGTLLFGCLLFLLLAETLMAMLFGHHS